MNTRRKLLVPITDCPDVAINEVRAMLYREGVDPRHLTIEPNVDVAPFQLCSAAFQIRLVADSYPPGTAFFCMANFGSRRPKRVLGRTEDGDYLFQGADTGAFSWLLDDFGCAEVYELHDPGFVSFGGKHIHPKTLARALNGESLAAITARRLAKEELMPYRPEQCQIVHIDNFGNAKLMLDAESLNPGMYVLSMGNSKIEAISSERMMNLPTGTWTIYPGSSLGLAEVGQVRSSGFLGLDAGVGDMVDILHLAEV